MAMAQSARLVAVGLLLASSLGAISGGKAQPGPSFRATCDSLRESLDRLGAAKDAYFTIQVVGRLEFVSKTESVALLGMCGPPHPRVLCVTYSTDDWKVGDTAMISGAFGEDRPDYIKLDPCLHAKAPSASQ
jgi:hypothetical protein